MPTILKVGPYRFFFYAGDQNEPPHVHVEQGGNIAKFWLNPVRLQNGSGFNHREIRRMQKIVEENKEELMRNWDEYFND